MAHYSKSGSTPEGSEFDAPTFNAGGVPRGSYYEMQAKKGSASPAPGTSPLAYGGGVGQGAADPALAGYSVPYGQQPQPYQATPMAAYGYAPPAPNFAQPAGGQSAAPYGRNSYFASLGAGALGTTPSDSPSRPTTHYPPEGSYFPAQPMVGGGGPMMPYPYQSGGMVMMGPPGAVGFMPHHPQYSHLAEPDEYTSLGTTMTAEPGKEGKEGGDAEDEAIAGTDAAASVADGSSKKGGKEPPSKRKRQGLRRLMCCAPRYCVGSVFGVCVVLFLVLFFAIPRVPTIGVAFLEVIQGPGVTYDRENNDYGLDLRVNVTMQAKSTNFYPLNVNLINLTSYDVNSGQKVGNGTVRNFPVRAQTTSYFNGTLAISYHSSNNSNLILNSLYTRCIPSAANDMQGSPKTGNLNLNIIAEINIDSIKWLGIHPKINVITELVCPSNPI
ncbi:hypothetical protein H4R33_003025 [Dimargaris cristalligena]|nr:hypothetical protein H4R33_003025 [Dimargaris cristalligena]